MRRELTRLTPDARGALRAPAALAASRALARDALAWQPDLVYVWNGSSIPQAALRVLADSGVPVAFRVCEHWFGGIFSRDQFMRELLPGRRSPARAAWALGCRAVNALPQLRLDAATRRCAPRSRGTPRRSGGWCRRSRSSSRCSSASVIRCPATATCTRASCGIRRREPEIVFLGRVTPYKGLSVAIEALALLRSGTRSSRACS